MIEKLHLHDIHSILKRRWGGGGETEGISVISRGVCPFEGNLGMIDNQAYKLREISK